MIIRLADRPDETGLKPILIIMKHTAWSIPMITVTGLASLIVCVAMAFSL